MIAITGGKGGCGKTTTALGLANALARRGQDPLVVDGDCDMPDVHHRIGLVRCGGVDELASGQSIKRVVTRSNRLPGVSFVTGGRRDNLDTALRRLGSWQGPVLVDCAAGVTADSLRPLRYAQRSVVVSTDQPQCIEDAERTTEIAQRLSAPPVGVVLREMTGSDCALPRHWRLLGTLPRVERPLESPQVHDEFVSIAKKFTEQTCRVTEY